MRNIKSTLIKFLLISLIFVSSSSAFAKTTIERITYRGWIDSYRLTSGAYSLVVVPEIGGRIMEYSINGRNVIWENPEEFGRLYPIGEDWHNYGGHKSWIACKNKQVWPPDPIIDYGKANVQILRESTAQPVLKVIGAASLQSGVLFTREISLNDSGEVLIKHCMNNVGSTNNYYGIWNVTQVNAPCFTVFPVNSGTRFARGFTELEGDLGKHGMAAVKDGLCVVRCGDVYGKIGSDSDGLWMIWLAGNLAYVKLYEPMVKCAQYPNGGCSVEVYANGSAPCYAEMELLSPIQRLRPGEQLQFCERWKIAEIANSVESEASVRIAVDELKKNGLLK